MIYEYSFFKPGGEDEIAVRIQTKSALPHIQVGHSLMLESMNYSMPSGHHLEITHVEIQFSMLEEKKLPETMRIGVHTRLRDRAILLNQ